MNEGLLVTISGAGEVAAMESIALLIDRQVIDEPTAGRLRFTHEALRDIAYERLDPSERRRLHSEVALALELLPSAEREARAGEIGDHWREPVRPSVPGAATWRGSWSAATLRQQEAEGLLRAYLALVDVPGPESIEARRSLGGILRV